MKFLKLLFAFSFVLLAMPASALAATLSLSPATRTFNKNCSFSLDVVLDTAGVQTDGTDAILMYDSSRLSATSITSGTIYQDFPGNNISESSGKITISGLASVASPFSGKGTLASINFTVRENAPTGLTQIKFEFDPNDKAKTTDSNVVERGTIVDVLNSVVDGSYTIGTGVCGTTPTISPTVSPTVSPKPQGAPVVSTPSASPKPLPPQTLPPAGSEQLTFTIAILGTVLTVLGILGLALL